MNDFCPFYFSQFLGFFEKTSKKCHFCGQKPTLWPKIYIKMATKFNVNTLKIRRLAKNPLFSLTYLKNEKIYIVIEDKKRVFGHSEFLLVNARPRVYHRTIVYERNASDSTR